MATVFIIGPSKALICTAPVPTIPKFAADPMAKISFECGDHFILVIACFYLMPYWRTGSSIMIIEIFICESFVLYLDFDLIIIYRMM